MAVYARAEVVHRACAPAEAGFGPTHANGWYELTWLEYGSASYRIGRRQLSLLPGECLLLPPEVENTPWVRGVSVHQTWIAPELIVHATDALRRSKLQLHDPLVFAPDAALSALGRGLFLRAQDGWGSADPGQVAALDAIAYALVAPEAPARSQHAPAPQLRAALELMAQGYAAPLSVEDLARAARMNRFTFMRAFRAAFGESPYRYLLGYRLERAAEALRGSRHESILEAAMACGFDDPGRFARMFRARFGMSPSCYRRQAAR